MTIETQDRRGRIISLVNLLLLPLFLSGQTLVRPTGLNLHFFEVRSIEEGEIEPYLSNRLNHEWRVDTPPGSDDLLRSQAGDSLFRNERIKFFPDFTSTFYPNGGRVNREGFFADIAPAVNLFTKYRLLPIRGFGLILWGRIEKHSVVSKSKISDLSYDFTWQKEIGRRAYQSNDSTWVEYSIGDGGIVLAYPYGEFTFAQSNPVWGPGYAGQTWLSEKAPSFPFLSWKHRFSDRWTFTYLHGSLNSTFRDSTNSRLYLKGGLPLVRKFVVAHRLDFSPRENINIGFGESVVYGARGVEMAYALPVLFYWSTQHNLSDSDNLQMFGDLQIAVKSFGRFYGSLYIDEWDFVDTFNKRKSRNWMAYQAGFAYLLPFLRDWKSILRFEASHMTPYVYVHRSRVNTFQHYGQYLGFWSGPNSDNMFLAAEGAPGEAWWVQIYVQRTRRGEVSDETVEMQYDREKIPFLFPFELNPETRILAGFRGELLLFSFMRFSFDLYYDHWLRRVDPQSGKRVNSQKFDAMIQLSIGL
ncbi:MAG: capsule assembly Wzi family protein [Candidatus Neomarinimicrobiota bacterium]